MAQDASGIKSHHKKLGLLKDQVRLVKRKDCDRHESVSIPNPLSFEKVRYCYPCMPIVSTKK